MSKWTAIWLAIGTALGLCGYAPGKEAPPLEDAIPASVKVLAAPTPREFPGGITMAVTAASDKAQAAVIQGLNHLHAGWEFEASRHFALAMRADPNCLLAHWGMAISLLVPTPPTSKARSAAVERMLDLLDQGQGTELERGYAFSLGTYLKDGPVAAAAAFHKVAKKFPNDMQSAVFGALFARGGYDEMGSATPLQQQSEDELSALIKAHPESPLPLNALLLIRAEALDLTPSLDLARKLWAMDPDYPPYCHLLGHYEWRCGEHAAAVTDFGRASTGFAQWMKANKTTLADCPDWVKAECYRLVALASSGQFDAALAAAKRLADEPLPVARASSAGVRMMLWEAATLPARLLMRRGKPGDSALALAALPKPAAIVPYHNACLAYWGIDGMRIALEIRRLVEEGNLDEARKAAAALAFHGEQMAKAQNEAAESGERSAWTRSFRAIELLASEDHARLALAGPANLRGTAYNWFHAAADRQRPPVLLYPPVVLTPMLASLGEYYLTENKLPEAIEAFNDALVVFPNDRETLLGLQRAYEGAKQPDKAAAIARKLKLLKQP